MPQMFMTFEYSFDGLGVRLFSSRENAEKFKTYRPKSTIYEVNSDVVYHKISYDDFSQEFSVETLLHDPETYYKGPKKLKDSYYFIVKHNLSTEKYEDVIDRGRNTIKQFVADQEIF